MIKYLFILIAIPFCAVFSRPPQWIREEITKELNSIPLESFKEQNIINFSKKSRVLGDHSILVKIINNNIFINEVLINWNVPEGIQGDLGRALLRARQKAPLPNCTFNYMLSSIFLDHLSDFPACPVLAGDKRNKDTNAILFVEAMSLAKSNNDWSLATVTQQTTQAMGQYPWESKIEKIFWRGYLSDLDHFPLIIPEELILMKKYSPRVILYDLSKRYPFYIDAGLTNIFPYNAHLAKDLGVDTGDLFPRETIPSHMRYKYQIVLDGAVTTYTGYIWRLLSDCCVFKADSTLYQWFYVGLQPWVHYIPIKTDLSDLIEKIEWAKSNDLAAKAIAINGHQFAKEFLTHDSIYDFILYVLNEYAKRQREAK